MTCTYPIRRSGNGDALATDGQRPDLGDKNPGARTPTVSEGYQKNLSTSTITADIDSFTHGEYPDEDARSPTGT